MTEVMRLPRLNDALPPKAEVHLRSCDVAEVPLRTHAPLVWAGRVRQLFDSAGLYLGTIVQFLSSWGARLGDLRRVSFTSGWDHSG
jgi:hypothetical protein